MTNIDTIQEIKDRLSDRDWRLNNLYFIKDKSGNKIKYKMNKFQLMLYENLWFLNIILKARQLGITTFFCILYLDAVLFQSNKQASIIAHTQKDAEDFFDNKVKFAFDNLPKWLKDELEVKTDSKTELSFRNGSSISVTTSTRSGTVQYLHISEFGIMCYKYPEKALEVVSGALNSVATGQIISIESTAKGNSGYFYDYCMLALENARKQKPLTKMDYKFFFFPWWQEESYELDTTEVIPTELKNYFKTLEEQGIVLNERKKQWYHGKYKTQNDAMYSEYPSTPEEAFLVSLEGAYYTKEMAKMFTEKRVTFVPWEPRTPVETYWDLGMNGFTVILFSQTIGNEIRIIDSYYNHHEGLAHYAKVLSQKPYLYNAHYFPHDVEVTEIGTGKSRKEIAQALGIRPIIVTPKLGIEEGVELVRIIFPQVFIDQEKCDRLIKALQNYRREWDDKRGTWKDRPFDDENAHFADAFRYKAVNHRKTSNITYSFDTQDYNKHALFPSL